MTPRETRPPFPFSLLFFWVRRTLPMWFLIGLMIFLVQIAVCGIIHDNERVKALVRYLELLPSFIKSALGGDAIQAGNTAGLILIGYNDPFVLILFMLYAVGVPTGLLTGEVQRGTMELILSRPTTKTQVYICAGVITIVGMFGLSLVMFLGTVAATRIFHFEDVVPLYKFFQTVVNGGLLASAVGGLALLSAAFFRRRNMAVGVTVAYLVVNYFVSVIAEWWPLMSFMKGWTIFYYVGDPMIFRDSAWPLTDMCVLTLILAVSAFVGGVIWQRRDLPL